MGNSASKKARQEKLQTAESNYTQATQQIKSHEHALSEKDSQLFNLQSQSSTAEKEVAQLRRKTQELDALSQALEQERSKQIDKLQAELRQKDDELFAQRRVAEARTEERDEAKKALYSMEAKVKGTDEEQTKTRDEQERKVREAVDAQEKREKETQDVREQISGLQEKIGVLEDENRTLSAKLGTAESTASQDLEQAKSTHATSLADLESTHANQLSSSQASYTNQISELQTALTTAETSSKKLETELSNAKKSLAHSTTKMDTLQRTHNEAVSRRAASHEAFTAMKMELLETQERYRGLYEDHEKRGRDLDEGLQKAKEDALKAEEKFGSLAKAHDLLGAQLREGAAPSVNGTSNHEADERLHAEIAVLKKRLGEAERRKSMPGVQVQEVAMTNGVEV